MNGMLLNAYVMGCLSATLLWSQLDLLPWMAPTGVLLCGLAIWFLPAQESAAELAPLPKIRPAQWALGAALFLPIMLHFLLTFQQEFPFSGDHDHHLLMALQLKSALHWWPWAMLAGGALLWVDARRWRWTVLAWWPLAWVAGTAFPPMQLMLRYPAGHYLLSQPLSALLWNFTTLDPMLGARLTNVLAPITYLFILRPWLLRRWPDLSVALLAGVFYTQKDWIYYGTANALEPWALVFVLLALEELWRGPRIPWRAGMLAGIACVFKEQGIFVLMPIVLLALWRERKWQSALRGLLLLLPFTFYYAARMSHNIWRSVEPLPWQEMFTPQAIHELAEYWGAHLETGGLLVMALLLIAYFVAVVVSPRRDILVLLGLVLVASEVLYFVDVQSRPYLGYPRFHYLTWPIFALGLWALWEHWPKPDWRLVAAMLASLQLASAVEFYGNAFLPDYQRNYLEFSYSPVFFPLKKLLREIEDKPTKAMLVNNPLGTVHFKFALTLGSPWLRDFKHVIVVDGKPCGCSGPKDVIVALFPYVPSGIASRRVQPATLGQADMRACLEKLRQSCPRVETEVSTDGQIVGLVGHTP